MVTGERQRQFGQLIDMLMARPTTEGIFNQYRDTNPDLDRAEGAAVRRRNLCGYLTAFERARYILVGEAAGYAGCRFSGIPFTGEAQLVGPQRLGWTQGLALERSSRGGDPWVERSANIVWEALGWRHDCLLWNAYPWHPMGSRGPLSNGHPGRNLEEGLEVLACLLSLFPQAQPQAVGRVAQRALAAHGIEAPYIRHPSHGGKRQFAASVDALPIPSTHNEGRRDL
jgi:hypothetical protein